MKKLYKLLIICVVALAYTTPVMAMEPNPTEDIMAGAEVIMRENYEVLAYKEMMQLTNLLMTDPVQYMDEYNKIYEIYNPYLDNPKTIYDVYSEEDIRYFQRCVETETHGCQIFLDKVHVADVILNRVKDDSDRFPYTIKEVVTAPGQFAYGKTAIDPLTVAACEYAFNNADTVNGAFYFHSGKKTETFNGATYLFTDEIGHHFYR